MKIKCKTLCLLCLNNKLVTNKHSHLGGNNSVTQRSQTNNLGLDDISGLQILCWIAVHADTFGCARQDDVTGQQSNCPNNISMKINRL